MTADSEVELHSDSMKLVAVGHNMCFWSTRGQGRLLQQPKSFEVSSGEQNPQGKGHNLREAIVF